MGAYLSSNQLRSTATATTPQEEEANGTSSVLAFHTKEGWNLHWEAHKQSNKLMVIDFKASWCGPCKFIEPAIKALAAKFTNVVFAKIDVDELPEVSEKWKVQAMPTFVLVKGGEEIDRVVGAKKDDLEAKIVRSIKV